MERCSANQQRNQPSVGGILTKGEGVLERVLKSEKPLADEVAKEGQTSPLGYVSAADRRKSWRSKKKLTRRINESHLYKISF